METIATEVTSSVYCGGGQQQQQQQPLFHLTAPSAALVAYTDHEAKSSGPFIKGSVPGELTLCGSFEGMSLWGLLRDDQSRLCPITLLLPDAIASWIFGVRRRLFIAFYISKLCIY